MTPAQKEAEQLIEQFMPFAHENFFQLENGQREKAKQCAIIAQQRIIDKLISSVALTEDVHFETEVLNYLKQL